jgi:hypothetical protein
MGQKAKSIDANPRDARSGFHKSVLQKIGVLRDVPTDKPRIEPIPPAFPETAMQAAPEHIANTPEARIAEYMAKAVASQNELTLRKQVHSRFMERTKSLLQRFAYAGPIITGLAIVSASETNAPAFNATPVATASIPAPQPELSIGSFAPKPTPAEQIQQTFAQSAPVFSSEATGTTYWGPIKDQLSQSGLAAGMDTRQLDRWVYKIISHFYNSDQPLDQALNSRLVIQPGQPIDLSPLNSQMETILALKEAAQNPADAINDPLVLKASYMFNYTPPPQPYAQNVTGGSFNITK